MPRFLTSIRRAPRLAAIAALIAALAFVFSSPASADENDAAPTSTDVLSWLEGNWRVGYDDKVLGPVTGTARVRVNQAYSGGYGGPSHQFEVDLVHPKSGATYRLSSFRVEASPTEVEIEFEGKSPPSGLRMPDDPVPPPVEGATPLPIPIGSTVAAKLDNADVEAPAVADEVPARLAHLTLVLALPTEGTLEALDAAWRYEVSTERDIRLSRAGDYDAQAKRVSGTERWTRPDLVIRAVTTLGQPNPGALRAALDDPASPLYGIAAPARAAFPPDGLGRIWLSIAGTDLPVQPRRRVEFQITDAKVSYVGAFRRNAKYPNALDVEVVIREGIENTPKPLTLNAGSGHWLPDLPGNEPLAIRYVRQKSDTEFDPVDTLYLGEAFFVEAIYREPPFADFVPVKSVVDGAEAESTYAVTRGAPPGRGGTQLYRSPPLLLLGPDEAPPAEGDAGAPSTVVRAADGTTLKTAELDAVEVRGKPVAVAKVVATPPSLWEQALDRARACRAGGADTEVTNYIVTELLTGGDLKQTIKITLEDHAAAILAREELVNSLDAYTASLNTASPVDYSVPPEEIAKQEAVWRSAQSAEATALVDALWNDRKHPLFNGVDTVVGPDGEQDQYTLDAALSWQTYFYRFRQDKAAFIGYARRAIAEAKGKMIAHASDALKHAREASDCDVVELLKVVGVGTKPVIERLLPRLVRPARADEPVHPRVVPDRVARSAVANIDKLAAAVAAQTEYSKLDTDAIIAAVTVPFIAGGALVNTAALFSRTAAVFAETSQAFAGFMRVGQTVMTASDLYDVYSAGRDTLGWASAAEDARFGLGISGIAGTERFHTSQAEARSEAFGVALGAGLSVVPNVAEGIVSGRIELPSGLRNKVKDDAMRQGVDALDPPERVAFDGMADDARARADAEGPAALTPDDRAVLAMADAHAAGRPTGPTGDATRPSIADPEPPPSSGADSTAPSTSRSAEAPTGAADEALTIPAIDRPASPGAPRPDTNAPTPRPETDAASAPPARPSSTGLTGAVESAGTGRAADAAAPAKPEASGTGSASAGKPSGTEGAPTARPTEATTRPEPAVKPSEPAAAKPAEPTAKPAEPAGRPSEPDAAPADSSGTRTARAEPDPSRTDPGDLRRPRREPDASRTDAGNLRRPQVEPEGSRTDAGALRRPNAPARAAPRWRDVWDRFDDSDLARSFDDDTIAVGSAAGSVPKSASSAGTGVGRGGYVYKPGDTDRLADYLRRSDAVPPEHVGDVVEFWRRAGVDPDSVMAGRAFNRNLDPATSGVPPERMPDLLDRYLRDHEGITDAARRNAMIDAYLNRHRGGGTTARLDEPDLPPSSLRPDGADVVPPPDLPPSTPRADGTDILPPPDLPPSESLGRTELLPPPDLPPSDEGLAGALARADGSGPRDGGSGGSGGGGSGSSGSKTGEFSEFKPDPSHELSTAGPVRNVDSDGDGVLDAVDDSFDPIAILEEGLPPPKWSSGDGGSVRGSGPGSAGDSSGSSRADVIPLDSSDLRAINQPANDPALPANVAHAPAPANAANAGRGPFDSSSIPPTRRITRPVANADNLKPETLSDAWRANGDGSWTVDGKVLRQEPDVVNPVRPPDNLDNAFSRKPKKRGAFADVRRMRDPEGKPTGHVSKSYGERQEWVRNPNSTVDAQGRCTPPPCWVSKVVQTPEQARAMAEDTLHGARVLEAAEIPQLDIVSHDFGGHPPRIVQRELGQNMPDTPDGRVIDEQFGEDVMVNGRLESPHAEAFAELIGKLKREGIFWEDMHLGNVFFQTVKRPDGTEYLRAGISDTDRIDLFGQPRAGREPDGWMKEFEEYPHEQNLPSRQPGEYLRDSEDAVLASLEHKGYLKWNPTEQCFMATIVSLAVLKTQVPGLKVCPGRSSELWLVPLAERRKAA